MHKLKKNKKLTGLFVVGFQRKESQDAHRAPGAVPRTAEPPAPGLPEMPTPAETQTAATLALALQTSLLCLLYQPHSQKQSTFWTTRWPVGPFHSLFHTRALTTIDFCKSTCLAVKSKSSRLVVWWHHHIDTQGWGEKSRRDSCPMSNCIVIQISL